MSNNQKVPGSWLCPTGYSYREQWNTLQRANGTSLMRHVPPSEAEKEAARRFDQHISTCPVCMS